MGLKIANLLLSMTAWVSNCHKMKIWLSDLVGIVDAWAFAVLARSSVDIAGSSINPVRSSVYLAIYGRDLANFG